MEVYTQTKVDISKIIKAIVPKLSFNSHKGDNGTVGTIGGSLEYTGAPYYSGIASLKGGSDLSHIFCHTEAAIPIKSYSPELIVHPGFNSQHDEALLGKTTRWFKSMNSIAVGPGLGRDEEISRTFIIFSNSIAKLNIPMVFDADALWFLGKSYGDLQLNNRLIITPNHSEYKRLYKEILKKEVENECDLKISSLEGDVLSFLGDEKGPFRNEIALARKLNATLVKKGLYDIITNGDKVYIVKNPGSLKRTGGIGDILTGLINCYCAMAQKQKLISDQNVIMECCLMGSFFCRESSRVAFEKFGYSMTAPDIINNIFEVTRPYML